MSPAPKPTSDGLAAMLQKEYELVNASFRQLSDIRFKLLAFVPALGGAATYVLSKAASDTAPIALIAGVMGFLATVGIVIYDQRNTQLYNALIGRAKFLEASLGFPHSTKVSRSGGQFEERPERSKRLLGLFLMGHDIGLATIYAPVLGAWFYPIVYSAFTIATQRKIASFSSTQSQAIALVSVVLVSAIFFVDLRRLDGAWKKLWP